MRLPRLDELAEVEEGRVAEVRRHEGLHRPPGHLAVVLHVHHAALSKKRANVARNTLQLACLIYQSCYEGRKRLTGNVGEPHDVVEGLEAHLDDVAGAAPFDAYPPQVSDGSANGVRLECIRVPTNYIPVDKERSSNG